MLEKLWLLIFNYKKYNKNYVDLKINDYLLYETDLIIRNNTIRFKILNLNCNIYMNIYIDNKKYNLSITKNRILLILNKILVDNKIKLDENIQEALKDMNNLEINISLHNNILKITGNNTILLDFKFNYNVNKLTYVILFDISKQNKLIDMNQLN